MKTTNLHKFDSLTSDLSVLTSRLDNLRAAVSYSFDELYEDESISKNAIDKFTYDYPYLRTQAEMQEQVFEKYMKELTEVTQQLQELFKSEWKAHKKADNSSDQTERVTD